MPIRLNEQKDFVGQALRLPSHAVFIDISTRQAMRLPYNSDFRRDSGR